MGFLPALLVHIHFAYVRSIQRRAISRWYGAMVWVFYAFPILEVASRMIVVRDYLRYVSVSGVMSWLATWSESDLVFAVLICALVRD